jgi:NAD(P)-dependent dehydrogenase (short-subunit alcohol dehydrogenase family)
VKERREVILLSGAAGGIGNSIAAVLSNRGYSVVGFDIAFTEKGDCAIIVEGDVTSPIDCDTAVRVASEHGDLIGLVNAAGMYSSALFEDTSISQAKELFEVNVWGAFNLMQAASGPLRSSDRGSVVNITSTSGELGIVGGSAYGLSKAALTALTRTVAVEWAPSVRVNAVAPSIVPTPMNALARARPGFEEAKIRTIPLGRMIEAVEVAKAVAFLISVDSSGTTGETLHVDGGVTISE